MTCPNPVAKRSCLRNLSRWLRLFMTWAKSCNALLRGLTKKLHKNSETLYAPKYEQRLRRNKTPGSTLLRPFFPNGGNILPPLASAAVLQFGPR